jgi:N-acetyl sugar amidotransferase
MNICSVCIMPDTRPDTPFVDGVCQACINYAARPAIDWKARKEQLKELVAKHADPSQQFDCIVPSSGGKDSTYQVIRMLQFGLRPLVVTARTCHLTPMGRANIDNLSRHATTWEIAPKQDIRAYLNREGLRRVGDISWPEHAAIFSTPWQVAAMTGIKLIMYGENPQNQYGGPWGSGEAMMMGREWRAEFGGFLGLRPEDFVGESGVTLSDMENYALPPPEALEDVEVHFLGQYLPWDSHENASVAIKSGMTYHLPCAGNWWPWENLDNAQTGLHDWFGWLKYGYTRGQAQLSIDVRSGREARDLALQACKRLPRRRPEMYAGVPLSHALRHIRLSVADLESIENDFTDHDIQARAEEFWGSV